jgi:hypothetical protein
MTRKETQSVSDQSLSGRWRNNSNPALKEFFRTRDDFGVGRFVEQVEQFQEDGPPIRCRTAVGHFGQHPGSCDIRCIAFLTRLEPFGKRRKEFGETEGRKAERAGASESISRINANQRAESHERK